MGSKGGSSSQSSMQQTQNQYGSHTPNLSDAWKLAYNNVTQGLNQGGSNAPQAQSMNYFAGQIGGSPVDTATLAANKNIDASRGWLGDVSDRYARFESQPARQAQAFTVADPSPVGNISAGGLTGAELAGSYLRAYGDAANDALANYDYGTLRGMTELDSRIAGSGAFANSRSEIPYSDLITQAALGRGQLSAQLRNNALTSAYGFGSQDANRLTQNNQFNTSADLDRQKFNTQIQQAAREFNANQQQNSGQFNVNAGYQGDQQNLAAIGGRAQTILSHAGLSQQQLSNVASANGVNMDAASKLFEQGAISQAQLLAIVDAANASNGSSYDQTTNTSGSQQGKSSGWSLSGGFTYSR